MIGGSGITINDNLFDLTFGSLFLQNATDVVIDGNRFNTYSSGTAFEFGGGNDRINIGVNGFTPLVGVIYQVDAGGSVYNSQIGDATPMSAATALYANTFTEDIIAPFRPGQFLDRAPFIPLTLSGSTFSAPDMSAGKNFLIALPNSCAPCTVPTPSTIPLPLGQHGYFAIVQSPTGTATLSWGPLYNAWTAPTLSTIGEAVDFVEYVVTQYGVSLKPQAPAQNSVRIDPVFTGGPGITSGWGASDATFANAVGGCADPIGSRRARLSPRTIPSIRIR